MLKTTLALLEPELREILKNEVNLQKTLELLSKYKINDWIYPGLFKHRVKIPITTVYKILGVIESKGFIQHYYEIICPKCSRSIGEVYASLDSIPEHVECDHCENGLRIVAVKSAYLIYMVNDNA